MIGFVSAISASLAIIVLVVLASLIGYVQSLLPSTGLVKIDEGKYRYVMEGSFVNDILLSKIIIQVDDLGLSNRVVSYQNGCEYGFNKSKRASEESSTYNYLVINQFFSESFKVDSIIEKEEKEKMNTCFIDINVKKE